MDLSFIGWALLIGLADSARRMSLPRAIGPSDASRRSSALSASAVLVQFFVLPYMDLTYAGYYVELTKPKCRTQALPTAGLRSCEVSSMKVTFLGAAHEVTGSCTLLEVGDKKGVIDCGMEQGTDLFENQELPVAAGVA